MSIKEKRGGKRPAKGRTKGQVTTEYILMAIVVVAGAKIAFNLIKSEGLMDDLASKPNEMVGNMMENGVWEQDQNSARGKHPNHHERHLTIDP